MGLGDKAKKVAIEHVKQKAARDILNGINEWRKNRISTAKRRWIFELIQNAVDTAKARKNAFSKVEIAEKQDTITFKHNGGYFTLDEVSAVIYGGSTKPYVPESEYIGRFGIGFLVSHIVSRRVKIRGFIKENEGQIYKFEMEINRKSDEEEDIAKSIEKCFQKLNESELFEANGDELYTEYIYYINDDLGRDAIKIGVNELKRNLPFIFAFNDIVQQVTINGEKFIRQDNNNNSKDSIYKINVRRERSTLPTVHVKKDSDKKISIGIQIEDNEILNIEQLPKIYVGMPLTETADYIKIPFVISSVDFEPTKERDALTSDSEMNKELLSCAFGLYRELLDVVSQNKNFKALCRTIDFQLIPDDKTSQNPLWDDFNEFLKKTFIEIVKQIPLVNTFQGKKELKDTIFPTAELIKKLDDDSLRNELFRKFCGLTRQIKKNTPIEEALNKWMKVVEELKEIKDFSDYINLYSIEDMKYEFVEFVKQQENFSTFEDFNKKFGLENSKQFLLSFFEIVNELQKKTIVSSDFVDYLLPAQTGTIGPLSLDGAQLYIDENIPGDLKHIAEKIGWEIRNKLLDNDFAKYEIAVDYIRNKINLDSALNELIRSYKPDEDEVKKEGWSNKIFGWIELLMWSISNKNIKEGLPIVTKDKSLKYIENMNKELIITPFQYLKIDQKYEDIYPESRIMHSRYFENENSEEVIKLMQEYRVFVTNLPLYKKSLTIRFTKLKSILVEDKEISKVDHKIESDDVSISVLPFWKEIIGRVSEYQDRGKLLFKFVVKYLINTDNNWEKNSIVKCLCREKEHNLIPSHWLASLKSDAWVPYKIIEEDEEKIVKREATKESIENLFTKEEIEELIKNNTEKITKLLPHFGFDELDLKIKLHSIKKGKPEETIRKEISDLVEIADIVTSDNIDVIKRHPDEFKKTMEELRKKEEKDAIREENKEIGMVVEKIIKKIVQNKGLEVKSIYIGGDLEIWPEDDNGWDSGLIEIKPYLVEVKFTSGTRVHLSKAQSEMAREKEENYVVLVVENANNLRELLKEIDGDSISDDLISTVENNSHVIEKIYAKLGGLPNPDEIEPDIHGYWVKKILWKGKNSVVKWLEQKLGDGG